MRARLAALLCMLSLALAAAPFAAVFAQNVPLNDLTSWRSEELTWRDSGNLPVTSEFSSPITAQYNWAYGATALGLTMHLINGADYYAVLALYVNHTLDAQDVIGPFNSPPQYSIGRYSLAVSTPDHLVYVWLTAPGADPRRVLLASDAAAGAPIACDVQPPNPPGTVWAQWRITLAYAYNSIGTQMQVLQFDGTGKLLNSTPEIDLPGDLDAVALHPAGQGWPQVMFAASDPVTGSSAPLIGIYLATLLKNGWSVARLLNAGRSGAVFPPGLPGSPDTAVLLSDASSDGAFLQQLQLADPAGGNLSQLDINDYFSQSFDQRRFCLFESVLSPLPLLAFTDDTDILLAWPSPSRGRAPGLPGYAYAQLQKGDVVDQDQPAYPILALTGTAHWSTGYPELYWVQQGNPDNDTGQLFRLAYAPAAR